MSSLSNTNLSGLKMAPAGKTGRAFQSRPERSPRSRWLRRIAVVFVLIAIGMMAAWFFRASILRWIGESWVVDEPLIRADAIMVLGGGPQSRPFAAAKLYHEGYAPKVLVANVRREPTDDLGISTPESDINVQVLLKQNVPREAIELVGKDVASTSDEAAAVRDWVQKHGAARVIIPTDPFHTRRVNWVFEKDFRPLKAQAIVRSTPVRDYSASNWWRHENGVMALQNEMLKLCYYKLKY
jgi:uncharacterized SAM-binding protein YcdF (DUF218 family)